MYAVILFENRLPNSGQQNSSFMMMGLFTHLNQNDPV